MDRDTILDHLYLPGPVHLISQAPELNIEWILFAVRDTHIRETAV